MCLDSQYTNEDKDEDEGGNSLWKIRTAIFVIAVNRADKQKRLLWRTRLLLRITDRYSHGRHV